MVRFDSVTAALAMIGLAAVLYFSAWHSMGYDMPTYMMWYRHIVIAGPLDAFADPFADYAPPYLYELALISLLHPWITPFEALKIAALVNTVALAAAAYYLLQTLAARRPLVCAAAVLILPTVFINGPVLAQTDALWVAPCLVAIAEAIRKRDVRMLVWFGVAGAVKLQAIFLAPFALGVMIRHRTPFYYAAVPLIAYTLIALPAALGGWPVIGLATIYFHQAGWGPAFIGNAANPWILGLYAPELAQRLFVVGTVAAAAASAWLIYAVGTARIALLRAALLSALIIPYLLPKMHERYYFAADVLAFLSACALRSRESVAIALLVTGASLAAILGNAREEWAITMAGAVLATAAVLLLIKDRADERGVDLERQPA